MKHTLKIVIALLSLMLLVACNIGRGFKPPDDYNVAWTSRHSASQSEINKTLLSCGVIELSNGAGLDRTENGRAIIQECLFAKGLYLKSGYGGSCATPEFRARIPACANAPLRSRDSYYGN